MLQQSELLRDPSRAHLSTRIPPMKKTCSVSLAGKPKCKVCQHMTCTNLALRAKNKFTHRSHARLTRCTPNVAYIVEGDACQMHYVDQKKTPFRIRFNSRRSLANSLPLLPLSRHVNLPGHSFSDQSSTLLQSGFRTNREGEQNKCYFIINLVQCEILSMKAQER